MLHVLPLSVAADGVFTLSDRTEARARAPDPITNALALDVDTLMDARAVWKTPQATYTVADLPRFTLLDYNGAAIQPAVMDSLVLAAEWRLHRVRLRVSENASYGQMSFESLPVLAATLGAPTPTPTPTGQPPPVQTATQVPLTTQSILFASSDTSVGSTLDLRPWTLIPRAGYLLAGGVNAAAEQVLPLGQGPYLDALADYKLGARNHLQTYLSASETSFSSGTDDLLLEVDERWRHAWSGKTQTMLAAGWYAARTRAAFGAPDVFASNAVAEAEFDHTFFRGVNTADVRLDLRLAPFINRLTGLVDEQIRGTVEAGWAHRKVKIRAFASAAESTVQGTATSTQLGLAEIDIAYKFSEALTVDGGFRALYQEQNFLGAPPAGSAPTDTSLPIVQSSLSQGVVFIAVTVRALKTKL
jgi:hypothetical protein